MHTYTVAATTLDSILCMAHIYHVILASYDKQLNVKKEINDIHQWG